MGRIIRFLILVLILAFLGVLGYSFMGDLSAPQSEVTVPVTLDAT
ncbi:hypothetical protein GGE09_002341 [Roseobacter sp. N2S]|nr:hypothetical protein [Roseobacter sp. N2S]